MLSIQKINKIFEYWSKQDPEPKTELTYSNNFTLAVAVILSAQATDISVNKATKNLFVEYNTPEDFVQLGEEGLKEHIKSIGLYNSKAKNIMALCQILIEQHDSQIPANFQDLIKLPGIGVKTANVILNCAFNQPKIAVDTHVFRVARRLGLASSHIHEKLGVELENRIPKKWLMHAHHWLILHGRYVCKARAPNCQKCAISKYCEFYMENV